MQFWPHVFSEKARTLHWPIRKHNDKSYPQTWTKPLEFSLEKPCHVKLIFRLPFFGPNIPSPKSSSKHKRSKGPTTIIFQPIKTTFHDVPMSTTNILLHIQYLHPPGKRIHLPPNGDKGKPIDSKSAGLGGDTVDSFRNPKQPPPDRYETMQTKGIFTTMLIKEIRFRSW